MSGLIGIPAQETARFSMFAASLGETDLPDGWEIYFRFGHAIGDNINACIEEMIRRDKEWFWLMGDDHAWSPGLLNKILDHCVPYASYDSNYEAVEHVEHVERKIIVPLCLMRNPPYRPVIWTETSPRRSLICSEGHPTREAGPEDTLLPCGCVVLPDADRYTRVELNDHPEGGVIEVAAAGGAGMLIHRTVIDAIGSGWFDAGRGTTTMVGEDINFCFPAGASIDGDEVREIQDVSVGDYVHTHAGRLRRVYDVMRRSYDGDLVAIKASYSDQVRLTPGHRLLIRREGGVAREWVEACDVRAGDRLCVPKTGIEPSPLAWNVADYAPGVVAEEGLVRYRRTRRSALAVAERVEATTDICRLLGYFVAEGSVPARRQHFVLIFGATEHEMVEDACAILRDSFGANPKVRTVAGATRVTVTSAILARLFGGLCGGRKAYEKRLPSGWERMDREQLAALVTGYWRGDGSYNARLGFRMTTSSRALAYDLRAALLRLGVFVGVRFRENASRDRYDISVPYSETQKFAALVGEDCSGHIGKNEWSYLAQDDDFYYVRVAEAATEKFTGEVFNLSVEDDESYTVTGFAAHNCEKAREHGFSIYCDLDSVLGHCATTVVWPVREPDGWTFGFAMMGGFKITLPPGFQAYADECA